MVEMKWKMEEDRKSWMGVWRRENEREREREREKLVERRKRMGQKTNYKKISNFKLWERVSKDPDK